MERKENRETANHETISGGKGLTREQLYDAQRNRLDELIRTQDVELTERAEEMLKKLIKEFLTLCLNDDSPTFCFYFDEYPMGAEHWLCIVRRNGVWIALRYSQFASPKCSMELREEIKDSNLVEKLTAVIHAETYGCPTENNLRKMFVCSWPIPYCSSSSFLFLEPNHFEETST